MSQNQATRSGALSNLEPPTRNFCKRRAPVPIIAKGKAVCECLRRGDPHLSSTRILHHARGPQEGRMKWLLPLADIESGDFHIMAVKGW